MNSKWLLIMMLILLTGCAGISPGVQQQAGPPVDFAALSAHPEQYQGRLVILGGEVMQIQPSGKGSLMTVSQRELDKLYEYKPVPSGGNFVVESDEWLSPSTYQPKSTVKVAGEVVGRRNGFVVLKAKEVVLASNPIWLKYYYPVPQEWYDHDPNLEYWFTPPYFDPYRPGGRR